MPSRPRWDRQLCSRVTIGRRPLDLLLILYFKKIHNSITPGNKSPQSIIQNANPINIRFDQGPWT